MLEILQTIAMVVFVITFIYVGIMMFIERKKD